MKEIKMKYKIYLVILMVIPTILFGQSEYMVRPNTADSLSGEPNNFHLICSNQGIKQKNKLFLFFPGNGTVPYNYKALIKQAANLGYHAIGLSFPNNNVIDQVCLRSTDSTCKNRIRLEIFDGIDRHVDIVVDANNCIERRALMLLKYLNNSYPQEHWDQYYNDNQIKWGEIIVAGHSQGGLNTEATSKINQVQKVSLFTGEDWLASLNRNDNLVNWNGMTPSKNSIFLAKETGESFDNNLNLITKNNYSFNAFGDLVLIDSLNPSIKLFNLDEKEEKSSYSFWKSIGITPLDDTVASVKDGLYFAPLIFYTPDTRWAFGMAGAYIFHIKDRKNTASNYATRASYLRFTANYTQNKQSDFWSEWSVFTNREKYYLKGELRMRSFPDKFYGIGNNTKLEDKEVYSYRLVTFKFLCLKQVIPNLFAGFDYHFTKEFNFKIEPDRKLATGNITGNTGGTGSALGLVTIFDKRDNVMNPYKGQYAELSSYFYRTAIGGSFNFTAINAEYRKYFKIKEKHIIALQAKSRVSFGSVPFLEMSQVGNDDILRSYPRNRFRDKNLLATQLEYRFPLFWRFGMTTFAGAGDVFNRFQDLNINYLKYTLGAGLRFLMNTAERLNVRIDYGYGSEGGYFYIGFTEAF